MIKRELYCHGCEHYTYVEVDLLSDPCRNRRCDYPDIEVKQERVRVHWQQDERFVPATPTRYDAVPSVKAKKKVKKKKRVVYKDNQS